VVLPENTGIQLVDIGGFSTEYINGKFVESPPISQTPFTYVTEYVVLPGIFALPESFVAPTAIGVQLLSVGGVRVEYASAFVVFPTMTHVPFPYAILYPTLFIIMVDSGIPIQLSAVGGFALE
jgi:hypothetical protein